MCVGLTAGAKAFSGAAFGQWGGLASIASLFMKKDLKLPQPKAAPILRPLPKIPKPFEKKELAQEPTQIETKSEDRLTMRPEDKPATPTDLQVATGPGITQPFDDPIGGRIDPTKSRKTTTQNIGISSGTGP